jgi:hypothetical protein
MDLSRPPSDRLPSCYLLSQRTSCVSHDELATTTIIVEVLPATTNPYLISYTRCSLLATRLDLVIITMSQSKSMPYGS